MVHAAPQMPWGVALDELPAFVRSTDGLDLLSAQSYTDPRNGPASTNYCREFPQFTAALCAVSSTYVFLRRTVKSTDPR